MFKLLLKMFPVILNNRGTVGEHLRYGQIKGGEVNIEGLIWAASQVIGAQSGKFVYLNNGALTLCGDALNVIFGWAQEASGPSTPTVGDKVTVNVAWDAVYRIPVNGGTFVIGMIGDSCDLEVTTNSNYGADTQGAQLDASTEDTVIIVGGDAVNNKYVDVRINPYPANAPVAVA